MWVLGCAEKFTWKMGLLCSGRPVSKTGTWLAAGNLNFRRVPNISGLEHLAVPKLLEQTIRVRLKTCFPFESLEFGHLPDRRWLCDRPPVKTLGTESLINFIHVCLQHITGVIKYILWLHWERSFGSFLLFSPRLYPMRLSLCWSCLVFFHFNASAVNTTIHLLANHQTWGTPNK